MKITNKFDSALKRVRRAHQTPPGPDSRQLRMGQAGVCISWQGPFDRVWRLDSCYAGEAAARWWCLVMRRDVFRVRVCVACLGRDGKGFGRRMRESAQRFFFFLTRTGSRETEFVGKVRSKSDFRVQVGSNDRGDGICPFPQTTSEASCLPVQQPCMRGCSPKRDSSLM